MFPFRRPKTITYRNPQGNVWGDALTMLNSAHTLIAGATGCGKSTAIHAIMWSALSASPASRQFIIIDMKRGREMLRYKDLPHTITFARTTEEALSALRQAEAIMMARYDSLEGTDAVAYNGPKIHVVIDELAFLLQNGGQEAFRLLITLSQLGRAAGVGLILATQDPSRKGLPAALVKNMTCCLGLRCISATDSRQIVNVGGCELLPPHGVGILAQGADIRKIGVPCIPEAEQRERLAWWSDPRNYIVRR